MSDNIKLTIIIPTRERADTLFHCLRTVVAQKYDNLRIVVSDNFSQDNTREIINSFADPRIKHINTEERVSMSHNWEFALSEVKDGWVTILGDDDGLLPGSLLKVANLIESTKIKAIRSSVCSYVWPGVKKNQKLRLSIPTRSGYEIRNTKLWLSKVLKGYAKYPELPMLYNGGFVCSSLIKKNKNKKGVFYQSWAPDVYSAIAFSSIIENYIYSNEPFAINGSSKHSTGTSEFSDEKDQKNSPANKFYSEKNILSHPDMPVHQDGTYPLSLQAIVYESYLKTKSLRDHALESSHQEQLEVILATSGRHIVSIREWGKIFANKHGLDYQKIKYRANRRRILIKFVSTLRNVSTVINEYPLSTGDLPINNVYEASLACALIRNTMPSRINNIYRWPKYLIDHIWRKWTEN